MKRRGSKEAEMRLQSRTRGEMFRADEALLTPITHKVSGACLREKSCEKKSGEDNTHAYTYEE